MRDPRLSIEERDPPSAAYAGAVRDAVAERRRLPADAEAAVVAEAGSLARLR